jgi:acetylglutamate kinase
MSMVIKIGGALLENPQRAVEEISRTAQRPFVVVHGGGVQITRMLEQLSVPSEFIDGLRVTDERTLKVVASALLGEVHTALVTGLCRSGIPAIGMFGVIRAQKKEGPWGLVGTNLQADRLALEAVIRAGMVPVVPTLAIGPSSLLNVNGDETAAAVAAALGAFDLVFLTDVEGVRDAAGAVYQQLTRPDDLLGAGHVTGGMVPKLQAVKAAMAAGTLRVRVGKTVFRSDS